mgnify:CR=1 FL=1
MKKTVRILSVIFLLAVYCFAVSIVNSSIKFGVKDSASEKEQYLYTISTNLHFNSFQLEKLVDGICNLHTLNLKKSVNEFCSIIKTVEQLIRTKKIIYLKY